MSKPKVFITRQLPEAGMAPIREVCDCEVWPERLPPPAAVLRSRIADCDGVLTLLTDKVDTDFLNSAPKLKVISNFAVGVNNIDLQAVALRGIPVGNTPGVLTEATADIAVTLLLAAARRLGEAVQDARDGRWITWEPTGWLGQELAGRTLGIVGMGRIGFATAKRLHHGWGMNVLYTARAAKPEADRQLNAKHVSFETLLKESDFVSVHVDLNDTTRDLFGAEQFAMMKPTAVFVNTARGPHVNQEALAAALKKGTIFAAGLDVTDPEPLPTNHELYKLPNCVLAPHIASATGPTRDAMAKMAAENLIAGVLGRPLPNPVQVLPLPPSK